MYISLCGLIGVGKSTLAHRLGKHFKCEVYEEGLSKYLDDFYGDMKKYSFQLQIDLLHRRYTQQQEIVWSNRPAIQDRTIYEDQIFCKLLVDAGLMEQRDYDTYINLFNMTNKMLTPPDVIIYLRADPERCYERIKKRNRECEKEVPLEYLKNLASEYDKFMIKLSKKLNVITVDYNEFLETKDIVKIIENSL
jgi:deoxyadenosine/deoxycytidine kinase